MVFFYICQGYGQKLPKIYPRYARDATQALPEVWGFKLRKWDKMSPGRVHKLGHYIAGEVHNGVGHFVVKTFCLLTLLSEYLFSVFFFFFFYLSVFFCPNVFLSSSCHSILFSFCLFVILFLCLFSSFCLSALALPSSLEVDWDQSEACLNIWEALWMDKWDEMLWSS